MNNTTTADPFMEYASAKKPKPVPEAAAYGLFIAAFAVLFVMHKRRAAK